MFHKSYRILMCFPYAWNSSGNTTADGNNKAEIGGDLISFELGAYFEEHSNTEFPFKKRSKKVGILLIW